MPLDSIAVLSPLDRATDANGNPVPGAKLKFYEAGTSTPKTVYSDSALTQSLGSTVTCDAGGYPTSNGSTQVSIYVGSDAYKLVVTTSADVTVHTRDNLKGAPEIPDVASTALPETPVISRTSTYSILSSDQGELIQADPTGGSFALTLPSAITVGDGWRVGVRHNGASTSNVATVRAIGGQAVGAPGQSAATSISLTGYGQTIWLVSNGADWVIDGTAEPLMMGGLPLFKVTDRLAAPPTSPVGGNRYIINGTPTGVWLTLGFAEKDIVESDGNGSWLKYTPQSGWMAWVDDEDLLSIYKDGAWDDQTGMSTPGTSTRKVAIFLDQKSDGTVGGSVTTGAWTTHALQTTVVNTLDSAVLATNVITLGAGTYKITGRFVIQDVNGAGISLLQGASTRHYGINQSSGADTTSPHVETVITIASGTDTIALQYYAQNSNSTSDLGPALALSGNLETYAILTIEDLSSLQGPQGEQGIQGNDGLDAAIPMQWSTATSGDPGSGKVRGNSGTIASITEIAVSETDAAGGSLGNVLTGWGVSTSAAKGTIKLTKEGAPQNFHLFRITASGTDFGAYRTFTATYVSTSGTISNGDDLAMLFVEKGDIGDPGTTVPDISGLTEDTANDDEADFLIEYDTSASSHKKVKPKNLGFTASGGTRRSLQSKLREFVHVDDFAGATFTDRLTAAIATGAKNIIIAAGTHSLTAGVTLSATGQRIIGSGRNATTIESTASGHSITLADTVTGVELHDFTLTRTGGAASSGQNGIHCAALAEQVLISRVTVSNHYVGFRLGTTSFSKVIEAIADNNYSHGFNVTNASGSGGFQWTLVNCLSQRSEGYGLLWEAVTSTASVGEIINFSTYANKLGGGWFLGQSSGPVRLQGIRWHGGFVGEDGNHGIYLDTYGTSTHKIEGVFSELAGVSAVGRNQGTSATNTGDGIRVTANQTSVVVEGVVSLNNSHNGIKSAADRILISASECRLNGAAASAGNKNGIHVTAGQATIVGNTVKANDIGIDIDNDNHVIVGNDLSENTSAALDTPGISTSIIHSNKGSTFNHIPNVSQAFALTGVVSPSQITSNQNDYSVSDTASSLRLSSDAARNITGFTGGAAGRLLIVHNVGANPIVLKDDDGATSTAANRFALPGDVTLFADDSVVLQYDSTTARWRLFGRSLTQGQLPATATNDSASAGRLGEYAESVIALGSAVSLTTATNANLTSISLTAGDWDVFAQFQFTGDTTTDVFNVEGSISTTSATHDSTAGRGTGLTPNAGNTFNNLAANHPLGLAVGPVRFSLSATTTLYAVASSVFADSTCSVFGILRARRVR